MKKFKQLLLAAGLFALAGNASALLISGSVGFTGSYTHDGIGDDLTTANSITSVNASVDGVASGTFVTEGVVSTSTVTYKPFTFDPLTIPVTDIWSVEGFTFDLNSMVIELQIASNLVLTGTGTIHHAGYQDTFGTWSFSADAAGTTFNFSSTTKATEPGVALLLSIGLIGFGVSRKLRKTA